MAFFRNFNYFFSKNNRLGPATTKNKRASIALSRTQLALADLARHDDDVKTDDAVNGMINEVDKN